MCSSDTSTLELQRAVYPANEMVFKTEVFDPGETSAAPLLSDTVVLQSYKCEHCQYVTENLDLLESHIFHNHAGENRSKIENFNVVKSSPVLLSDADAYTCEFCKHQTTNVDSLQSHVNEHHCDKLTTKTEVTVQDSTSDPVSVQKCEYCECVTTSVNALQLHVYECHPSEGQVSSKNKDSELDQSCESKPVDSALLNLTCKHCEFVTTSDDVMQSHVHECHCDVPPANDVNVEKCVNISVPFESTVPQPQQCEFCKYAATGLVDLQLHVYACHRGVERLNSRSGLDIAEQSCERDGNSATLKGNPETEQLKFCHEKPLNYDTFELGISTPLNNSSDLSNPRPFKCNYCDYATTRSDRLNLHFVAHHINDAPLNREGADGVSQSTGASIPVEELKPYLCNFCNYTTARRDSLQSHLRLHTGEKPYVCDTCGFRFAVKQRLQVHIRARHTGEKPYKCEVCNASFAQKGQLKSHAFVHVGGKQFACEECGCTFARKSNLRVHYRVHSDEKPHKCDQCGAAFSHKNYLKVHARVHTGERPYKCETCGSAFATKCNLQTHIKTHSGLKPFKCSSCDGTFSSKGDLQTHMHLHTGIKPYKCATCGVSFALKHYLTSHTRTHTQERPHACNVCGARFTARGSLRTHERIHTGEMPYKCTDCDATFAAKSNLRWHARKHQKRVVSEGKSSQNGTE